MEIGKERGRQHLKSANVTHQQTQPLQLTHARLTVESIRITTGLTSVAMTISPLTLTFNPANRRLSKELILSDPMIPVVPMAQLVGATRLVTSIPCHDSRKLSS